MAGDLQPLPSLAFLFQQPFFLSVSSCWKKHARNFSFFPDSPVSVSVRCSNVSESRTSTHTHTNTPMLTRTHTCTPTHAPMGAHTHTHTHSHALKHVHATQTHDHALTHPGLELRSNLWIGICVLIQIFGPSQKLAQADIFRTQRGKNSSQHQTGSILKLFGLTEFQIKKLTSWQIWIGTPWCLIQHFFDLRGSQLKKKEKFADSHLTF